MEREDELLDLMRSIIEEEARREAETDFVNALLRDDWGEESIAGALKNLRDKVDGAKNLDTLLLYLFGELIKEGRINITTMRGDEVVPEKVRWVVAEEEKLFVSGSKSDFKFELT